MRICSHRPQRAVLEEGSHAGARNRRALTLTHQFCMHIGYEWKSKRKYIALFPHAAIGSLHQGKLSNLINVTELADRNLAALTPNLHFQPNF